jgi:hypothetical protein
MPLHDSLDVEDLVAGSHREVGRFGSHRLVLGYGHLDLLRALSVAALAVEINTGLAGDELLGDLGHPLVNLAEEGFVRAEPLLPFSPVPFSATAPGGARVSGQRGGKPLGKADMRPEDIFRRANNRIAEKARELNWRFPVPFICECSDLRCFARVELMLEAYEELRSHPQRYLTAPWRHEVDDAFVIEQEETFVFAEKLRATD